LIQGAINASQRKFLREGATPGKGRFKQRVHSISGAAIVLNDLYGHSGVIPEALINLRKAPASKNFANLDVVVAEVHLELRLQCVGRMRVCTHVLQCAGVDVFTCPGLYKAGAATTFQSNCSKEITYFADTRKAGAIQEISWLECLMKQKYLKSRSVELSSLTP
jgi:hypothetical protein